jgi:hypothetical protein
MVEEIFLPGYACSPGMKSFPSTHGDSHSGTFGECENGVQMVRHQQKKADVPPSLFVINTSRIQERRGKYRCGEVSSLGTNADVIPTPGFNPRGNFVGESLGVRLHGAILSGLCGGERQNALGDRVPPGRQEGGAGRVRSRSASNAVTRLSEHAGFLGRGKANALGLSRHSPAAAGRRWKIAFHLEGRKVDWAQ